MLKLSLASVSLLGDRAENQDRADHLSDANRTLLLLGDGMGGHSDGAAAAQALVETAQQIFAETCELAPPKGLQDITTQAYKRIIDLHPDLPDMAQPRTTVVFCLFNGGTALFAHAGDSRAYQYRNGEILCRTRDHSVVEVLARTGRIREEDTRSHPLRSQVSRCLGGFGGPPSLEFSPTHAIEVGDTFLICSDGLWEPLSDLDLAALISVDDIQAGLNEAAERAVKVHTGYADNCTALVARVEALEA